MGRWVREGSCFVLAGSQFLENILDVCVLPAIHARAARFLVAAVAKIDCDVVRQRRALAVLGQVSRETPLLRKVGNERDVLAPNLWMKATRPWPGRASCPARSTRPPSGSASARARARRSLKLRRRPESVQPARAPAKFTYAINPYTFQSSSQEGEERAAYAGKSLANVEHIPVPGVVQMAVLRRQPRGHFSLLA